MDVRKIVQILKSDYTLSELEERLEMEPADLEYGYTYYVEENYENVLAMLREDLYLGD